MSQIGEGIAAVFGWGGPEEPGSLEVTVVERHSQEPVPNVEITLHSVDGRLFTLTGGDGKAHFPHVPPGLYFVRAAEPEFQIGWGKGLVYVAPGEAETTSLEITRILLTVLVKRIPIGPSLAAMEFGAGHHWIEIDGDESYGWHPEYFPGLSFYTGVPGRLNGRRDSKATPTRDVHHGEDADVMFHPRIMSASSAAAVKSCIRTFAHAFRGLWSYPRGPNCHTFQRDAMAHCGLGEQQLGKFVYWMFN